MSVSTATNTRKLVYAALFLALGLLLPFLTGQIPQIGSALSPMHIPVLLCGFICGWPYGLAVGFITPLLRSVLFGMPPMYPTALAMAFELATYGLIAGILYATFKKKDLKAIYCSLIVAMICGRIVWGIARWIMAGLGGNAFTFQAFLAGAITNAVPGIILHLILIPIIMVAYERFKKSRS